MSTVRHRGYRIRVVFEQVLDVQVAPSTPVDSGRDEKTIEHSTRTIDIPEDEFLNALREPIATAERLKDRL